MGLGIVDPGTSPSEAAARNEFREQMRQALAQLKDSDRDILWMRHNDGLSLKEAAAVLGISDDAAAQRYVRALRRLQELWHQAHPGSRASQ
jgi:RNA polymerase sigma-70 factor (ECF subfamily)